MKVSKEARKGARLLYNAVSPGGRLDESKVRQVLAAVAEKRPAGAAQVMQEFKRLVRLNIESRTALVESAAPLDVQQKAAFDASLKQGFGPDLHIGFSENPDLVGGVRIRIGSDVFDANIRERLSRLRAELSR